MLAWRALADAASARGAQGLHARRGRPVGHQPICQQRSATPPLTARCPGTPRAGPGECGRAMQASNAAMVSGEAIEVHAKAFAVEDLRHQAAILPAWGVTPAIPRGPALRLPLGGQQCQLALKGPPALAHQWLLPGIFASSSACRVPVGARHAGLFSGWISQATICAGARPGAGRGRGGQQRRVGCSSSRYSMMAMDCGSTAPSSVTGRAPGRRLPEGWRRPGRGARPQQSAQQVLIRQALDVERDAHAKGPRIRK